MKITAKIRLGCHEPKVEGFGNNRYLVNLISEPGDKDASEEFLALMSRYLGVPKERIVFVGKDSHGDKIFET